MRLEAEVWCIVITESIKWCNVRYYLTALVLIYNYLCTSNSLMTKVISFISRKGGTGKTTNAINLANVLHRDGKKIVLVETDTNYTVNSLRQLELFKTNYNIAECFHLVASEDHVVAEEIKRLVKLGDYDYVIVDSAGKTTDKGIRALALISDLICVTTSLNQHDLLVTYQTIKDLKPAQDFNKKLKLLLVPNRIEEWEGRRTIRKALAELETPILRQYVPNKKNFQSSSTIKLERRYRRVAREIINYLN